MKLEFRIKKHLTKVQKEMLVKEPEKLETLLGEKLDCSKYQAGS